MRTLFAETLRKQRIEKGLSQRQLAERMHVTRPSVARWEGGSRLPDAMMIARLADCLDLDVNALLSAAAESEVTPPHVILVEDRKIVLSDELSILEEVLPEAEIIGFTRPSEAVEYARVNRVALAFLDIELGKTSGLDLCRSLLEIYPRTNVVFLTAYVEYSFNAWSTGASGFMLKPLTSEGVREQLQNLRYPMPTGGGEG